MSISCVTRNLGRWPSSQQWVDQVATDDAPDLLFLQEIPSPVGLSVPPGYVGYPGELQALRNRGHCRSLILVADRLAQGVESSVFVLPELLQDYVVDLWLHLRDTSPIQIFNVHASPGPIRGDVAPYAGWRRPDEARVYHSDVISMCIAEAVASGTDVLAVGDFNEALAWDQPHRTNTSVQFFDRLRANGLVDVTMKDWGEEVTTQVKHPYQVDRIFASAQVNVSLQPPPLSLGVDDGYSDHLPIVFALAR